jgi:hypothetical protein
LRSKPRTAIVYPISTVFISQLTTNVFMFVCMRSRVYFIFTDSPKQEIPNVNIRDLTHQQLRLNETHGKHLPFYRYKGSLTTPGCAEVVTWTVMEPTIPISASQVTNSSLLCYFCEHMAAGDGPSANAIFFRYPKMPSRTSLSIVSNYSSRTC